ncbi:hypothetical protein ACFTAO_04360 [Paenibacillus rhizoplanae]
MGNCACARFRSRLILGLGSGGTLLSGSRLSRSIAASGQYQQQNGKEQDLDGFLSIHGFLFSFVQ